jgi:hypothetical protein
LLQSTRWGVSAKPSGQPPLLSSCRVCLLLRHSVQRPAKVPRITIQTLDFTGLCLLCRGTPLLLSYLIEAVPVHGEAQVHDDLVDDGHLQRQTSDNLYLNGSFQQLNRGFRGFFFTLMVSPSVARSVGPGNSPFTSRAVIVRRRIRRQRIMVVSRSI